MPASTRLSDRLSASTEPLILDGGLASELSRSGFDLDHPLWSARLLTENPEAIEAVTRSFAAAGADLLATATYQATFPGLEKEGLSRPEAVRLFQRAIALTRRVADEFSPRPLVAASIGPYGAYLADGSEYRGNYGLTSKVLAEFHRPRLEVFTDTAADLLAFETFPSAQEALAIADLLADRFSDHEAWISFSCRDDSTLWDGTPIAEIAGKLRDHPVVTAIGVNCVHPDHTNGLVAQLREAAPNQAVIVYPNAGRGWDAEARRWSGTDSPAEFADRAPSWIDAGARIVGGCCLASPDHIAALRERFKPA